MSRSFSAKNILAVVALVAVAFMLGRITAGGKTSSAAAAGQAGGAWNQNVSLPAPRSRDDSKSAAGAGHGRPAMERLDLTPPSEQREDERLKLLLEWAATDPLGAMEYAKQHLKSDRLAQAMAGIATEWAKHDPAAAWGWARSLGPDETHHAHTVLEEVARNDPALAGKFAAEFARQKPEDAVAMCLTAMRGMAYNGNFEAARRLAGEVQLSSPEDQGVLMNFMAGQWARFEPDKTAQWVQSLPEGALRNQALIGLGESWAEADPPRAADFAAQLPAGETRQAALRQAIANWILTDPAKASTWINQFPPHEDFDQAVASVATMRFLVEEHVDLALNWANTIFNEPLRQAAMSEILSQWSQHNRPEALHYIQTAPGLSPSMREQLLRQFQAGAE